MKNLLTTLAALFIIFTQAQNVDFKKKNFDSETDFKTASAALEKGDDLFFSGGFDKALPRFLEAQELNPNNALLNFKIGACYLKIDELKKATPYFKKAKELDPKVDPKIDFALAQSYQANEQYADAVESYQLYLASLSKSKRASEESKIQKNIDVCTAELQKKQSKIEEAKEITPPKKEDPIVEKTTEPSVPKESTAINIPVKEEKPAETKTVKKETPKATKAVAVATPIAASKNNTLSYRIQIASATSPASENSLKKIYSGPLKITNEKIAGRYKYFAGNFSSKEEAIKAKNKIGVPGAFIVKFKNGKKL